ncbi:hypothetical protein [Deinococcus ruber]|uniref:Uncharacterized protein n=1 Tax=Deinococcus ruber TaxID=1848197 RepID=A0A918F9B6_9DEIO|nr:hypothetical protein [Deinococcus ruber]GGR21313.1 hypothetical protein GCM10008957_37010 [Deinococcus ruber]
MRPIHLWHAFVKAQAHTLKSALVTHGHTVPLGHALDLCAQFAGHPSWNHHSAALHAHAGAPGPFNLDLVAGRLIARGYPIPQAALPDLLSQLEEAGLEALRTALDAASGRVTVLPIPATPLSWLSLSEPLSRLDDQEVQRDLNAARPHWALGNPETELLSVLEELATAEGPGVLAGLHVQDGTVWAYLPDERTALLFALAHATLPDALAEDELEQAVMLSRMAARRRSLPPLPAPDRAEPFAMPPGELERWVRVWAGEVGRSERMVQLQARVPQGYPVRRALPDGWRVVEAHQAFWDALELAAHQARQSPPTGHDWLASLGAKSVTAILQNWPQALHAVVQGQASAFPPAAQADVRSAVAVGVPVRLLERELQALLDDLAWHLQQRQATWAPVRRLKDVKVGDTLRVDSGSPFRVQTVLGIRFFELSVIDHRGLLWEIRDTQDLERQII